MHISPLIPLWLGIAAGSLFLIVFLISVLLTVRSRKIIRKWGEAND